jgi:hypothetical protein
LVRPESIIDSIYTIFKQNKFLSSTATDEETRVMEYMEYSGINEILVRCVKGMIVEAVKNPIAYIIEFMYREYPELVAHIDTIEFNFAMVTVCEAPTPVLIQDEMSTEEGSNIQENSIDELKKNVKKSIINDWVSEFEAKHGRKPDGEESVPIRDLYLDYKAVGYYQRNP